MGWGGAAEGAGTERCTGREAGSSGPPRMRAGAGLRVGEGGDPAAAAEERGSPGAAGCAGGCPGPAPRAIIGIRAAPHHGPPGNRVTGR